jgi:hypothetical protein
MVSTEFLIRERVMGNEGGGHVSPVPFTHYPSLVFLRV